MAPKSQNLNDLWVRERNPDILSFSVEKSGKRIPFTFFNVSPFDRDILLWGIFTLFLLYLSFPHNPR